MFVHSFFIFFVTQCLLFLPATTTSQDNVWLSLLTTTTTATTFHYVNCLHAIQKNTQSHLVCSIICPNRIPYFCFPFVFCLFHEKVRSVATLYHHHHFSHRLNLQFPCHPFLSTLTQCRCLFVSLTAHSTCPLVSNCTAIVCPAWASTCTSSSVQRQSNVLVVLVVVI